MSEIAEIRTGQLAFEMSVWDEVETYDKIQGSLDVEAKVRLLGVPMVVTAVAFRLTESGSDFVSVECVTAPFEKYDVDAIIKYRKNITKDLTTSGAEELGYSLEDFVQPLTHVVFNDSSTGVRRQIVSYLEQKNLIQLKAKKLPPEAHDKLDGAGGTSPFDETVANWKIPGEAVTGISIRLVCPKGVRLSAYESTFGPASTFYLA